MTPTWFSWAQTLSNERLIAFGIGIAVLLLIGCALLLWKDGLFAGDGEIDHPWSVLDDDRTIRVGGQVLRERDLVAQLGAERHVANVIPLKSKRASLR